MASLLAGRAARLSLVLAALLLPLCAGIRQAATALAAPRVPPPAHGAPSTLLQEAALAAGGAETAAPRRVLTVLLAAAAAPALREAAAAEDSGAKQDVASEQAHWKSVHIPPKQMPVQERDFDKLPLSAPKVPIAELDDQLREKIEMRRGDWPFEWMWSSDLYLRFPGQKSAISGTYSLDNLDWWHPRWRRIGGGREAVLEYYYNSNTGAWRYRVELVQEVGTTPGEATRIECGNPDGNSIVEGEVGLKEPTWSREVVMVTQGQEGDEARITTFELLPGFFREGMPVWRSMDDGDGDQWLVSQDGKWILGVAPEDSNVAQLLEQGFFEQRGDYAQAWARASPPHGGRGPDAVPWKLPQGAGRGAGVVSVKSAGASSSSLQVDSAPPSGQRLTAESAYSCSLS